MGALVVMVLVLGGKGKIEAGPAAAKVRRGRARPAGGEGKAGAGFLWLFAFFWNAVSFPAAILFLPGIIEGGEWAGLLVLLFPLVGVMLLWAAASATWSAWLARRGKPGATTPARPAAREAGTFAAKAARAMFDPPAAEAMRVKAPQRRIEIPPELADVEERGDTLTLRYSGRRRLGLMIGLAIVGTLVALVGAALLLDGRESPGAVGMLIVGGLVGTCALVLFLGKLVVTVKAGEIAVEQTTLFGKNSWRARLESITSLGPVVSHSVNGLPYFSLYAETASGRVPLGNSIKGAELADAMAHRIAGALGAPLSLVAPAAGPASGPNPE